MKKFVAAAFALGMLVLQPAASRADWNKPQTRHGHGWIQGIALNTMPWLHFHGPLYSYGPYTGPGHVPMYVKNPIWGAYVPAYPVSYYGYENPPYYPNTIQPSFPAAPQQTLTGPTNYYYSQGGIPATAAPVASPSVSQQPVGEAAAATYASGRTPLFSGQFRSNFRR